MIIFIIICIWIIAKYCKRKRTYIPKIIYTFWKGNDTKENVFITKCIQTWMTHNPNWKIIVLNEINVHEYAPESYTIQCDNVQQFSDFVRLEVLEKYGGVWMDASIWMNSRLDSIIEGMDYELIGYKNPIRHDTYIMENWFIAASTNCRFVKLWKDEFFKMKHIKVHDYLTSVPTSYKVDIENPLYLSQNVAWNVCYHNHPKLHKTIYLYESAKGPFELQWKCNWDPIKYAKLFHDKKHDIYPMLKITNIERNQIVQLP